MVQDASTRPTAAQLENHKLIAQSRISPRPNLANDVSRAKAFLSAKAAAATEAFGLTANSTLQCVTGLYLLSLGTCGYQVSFPCVVHFPTAHKIVTY